MLSPHFTYTGVRLYARDNGVLREIKRSDLRSHALRIKPEDPLARQKMFDLDAVLAQLEMEHRYAA